MDDYKQEVLDTMMDEERSTKENLGIVIDYAEKQLTSEGRKAVTSRHEGYGVLSEQMLALNKAMKQLSDALKGYLLILSASDREAIDAAARTATAAQALAYQAVLVTAQGNMIADDLYHYLPEDEEKTPIEEMEEEFQNAEEKVEEDPEEGSNEE